MCNGFMDYNVSIVGIDCFFLVGYGIVLMMVNFVVVVIGMFGNFFVCVVVLYINFCFCSWFNIFFVSLVVVDLIVMMVC